MKMSKVIACAGLSLSLAAPLATGAHAADAMMKKHAMKHGGMMKHGSMKHGGMMKGDAMQKDQPSQ